MLNYQENNQVKRNSVMRAIYKIARLELSNLFYSPVAWLILVLVVFMTGMTFGGMLEGFSRQEELKGGLWAISQKLFYGGRGALWLQVSQWFYLIMPLLTMGLISQEFSRGSIKLLFSAPITGLHIVLGKYLGIMLYGLIMMFILLIMVVIGGYSVESFEWSAVLTGLLGLYLLFGLYAAVGLFISTLTNYPIVAAIGMLFLLGFLSFVSSIWQEFAFVRELTYWLSLGGRVNTFIRGMICSEDVVYFIIMTAMFLGFAVLKMKLLRESCSFAGRIVRYLGIFTVTMLVGYVTSRPVLKCYYDATLTKTNTLTQASQDIMSRLDGKLKFTTYVNLFKDIYTITDKSIKRDMERYESYVRFKPDMELDYVFYYRVDTTTEAFKKRYPGKTLSEAVKDEIKLHNTRLGRYLTPEEIAEVEVEKGIDLNEEGNRFVTLIERESGERTFLRVYREISPLPSETEISAALKRIGMKLPRVGFLSDRGARSIVGDRNRDYSYSVAEKTLRRSMINQGFDVVDISLKQGYPELERLDVLVVSEPLEPFTSEEWGMLFRYVESGKNLLVAAKPKTYSYLTPLMEQLGLQFEPGTLVQQPLKDYTSNLLLCTVTDSARELSNIWEYLHRRTHIVNSAPYAFVMPGALAIEQKSDKGFRVIPVLETRDSAAWNELETIDFINETPSLNSQIGERAGVKTTMVALEREKAGLQQRIMVLGDADCFSMGELSAARRGINSVNGFLLMSMFDWYSYGELPVNTSRPGYPDNHMTIGMETGALLKTLLQWVFPALLLLIGIFILIRRKGK